MNLNNIYELWDAGKQPRLKTIASAFDEYLLPNPWRVMSINNLLNLKKWNLASGLNWEEENVKKKKSFFSPSQIKRQERLIIYQHWWWLIIKM
jgi:hypothetical protein